MANIDFSGLSKLANVQSSLNPLPAVDYDAIRNNREYDLGFANVIFEQLVEQIKKFDSSLNAETEVGLKLASFGQSVTIYVDSITFRDPYLIVFIGQMESGGSAELIQHVNQLSFLMVGLPKREPEQPKRPIGYNREN